MKYPKEWHFLPDMGGPVGSTRIIPAKTPFQQSFSPQAMIEKQKEQEREVGLVVDLTLTDRYYDPKELEALGVEHAKTRVNGGGKIPEPDEVTKVIGKIHDFLEANPSKWCIVHCTHGYCRTGFMIVSYLVEKNGLSVEEAIAQFAAARPPAGIYRKELVRALVKRYAPEKAEDSAFIASLVGTKPVNKTQASPAGQAAGRSGKAGHEEGEGAQTRRTYTKRKGEKSGGAPASAAQQLGTSSSAAAKVLSTESEPFYPPGTRRRREIPEGYVAIEFDPAVNPSFFRCFRTGSIENQLGNKVIIIKRSRDGIFRIFGEELSLAEAARNRIAELINQNYREELFLNAGSKADLKLRQNLSLIEKVQADFDVQVEKREEYFVISGKRECVNKALRELSA